MSLRSQLEEDKKQLAALQAKVQSQEATLHSIQPKLNILDSIESQLAMLEATSNAELAAKIHPIRESILEQLAEISMILLPDSPNTSL